LCFLDISASLEARGTLVRLVEEVALTLNIPFAVGGGVRTADEAEALLRAGADKVSMNTAAIADPSLITSVAKLAGSQSAMVASGGAGTPAHFADAFAAGAAAALAASVFHFGTLTISAVKDACAARGFPMRR